MHWIESSKAKLEMLKAEDPKYLEKQKPAEIYSAFELKQTNSSKAQLQTPLA